ncbi:hypothetical protein AB1Y20_018214 [Prymnesium parvum]|uniref:Glycosyl transferase 48 domain-containing protein n=1 Tax=Prymnesium parvum TaxID=97485 RepID=A0AB34JNM8_PRYPA
MYTFHRVVLLNALALHVMMVFAFAHASCKDRAEQTVPDQALSDERAAVFELCLRAELGTSWLLPRTLSTVALTHGVLQLFHTFLRCLAEPLKNSPRLFVIVLLPALSHFVPWVFYTVESVRTNFVSGLSDAFVTVSFVYCLLWLFPLLQLPIKYPFYSQSWSGVAPQRVMRPSLRAGLWYTLFWMVVVGLKWLFEYYLIVQPMYKPSRALWEAHYSCWEHGHTGTVECSDKDSPEALRIARNWVYRLMLIGLRWSMPIVVVLSDIVIFFTAVLAVTSVVSGWFQGLGQPYSWSDLVVSFVETQQLFTMKLMPHNDAVDNEKTRLSQRAEERKKAAAGEGWSHEGTSFEWRAFALTWNALVDVLHQRDLLSIRECKDLCFTRLVESSHKDFFGVEYMALPAMLSAPVYTISLDNSIVSPSFTSYAALMPILIQLRDLMACLLEAVGLLNMVNRNQFRKLTTELAHYASKKLKVTGKRTMLSSLASQLQSFVSACERLRNVENHERLAAEVKSLHQMFHDEVLNGLKTLMEGTSSNEQVILSDLFSILRHSGSLETEKLESSKMIISVLLSSFSTQNPGGEPQSTEAKRQLISFCNSLRNTALGKAPSVRNMKSVTVLTPYYNEDVTHSEESLVQPKDGNTTFLEIVRAMHPDSWANMRERLNIHSSDVLVTTPQDAINWVSDRTQVLSRTVRGVMLYGHALYLQAMLENTPDEVARRLVQDKFRYVLSCQQYDKLQRGNEQERWKVKCIDELRQQFAAHLRVAYVKEENGEYYSVLLGCNPSNLVSTDQVLFKVKLPGNPMLGEGKPENQNHAIIFTRGEYLQTLDMNQDNYLGEALKLRNMLECFKGNIRIVGCREHIFSQDGGAVAAFAASKEFTFSTVLQRFLTYPLCVRFHYGHPDVWDKQWAMSNGGVSKASKSLHLSEDIFGGVNVIARGGEVSYVEYIHVGKGRDITFITTNSFDEKVASGNALQAVSRDMARFAHYVDLPRLLSFWCASSGFFISTVLAVYSAYFLAVTLMVLSMMNMEGYFDTPGSMHDLQFSQEEHEPNFGTRGGEDAFNAQFIFQLGYLTILPLFAEEWLEFGGRHAMSNLIRDQSSLRLLYTLFSERTRAFHFDRALQLGEAHYVSTGRSFDTMTASFLELFQRYGRSHLVFAAEIAAFLVAYGLYSRAYTSYPSSELAYYALNTLSLWLFVVGCALAPWLFNP